MMNFLQKIFGQKHHDKQITETGFQPRTVEQIQKDTNRLWALLRETIEYYKSLACPCAFPRFIQYASIDCRETHNSFYMSETEGFIQTSGDCFDTKEIDKGDECFKAIYTCKTCGSTYINAWSDFSIRISRTYLKPLQLKANQVGADAENPIPFFVGIFGHSYPDRSDFRNVDFETFKDYIRALKNGT
jgi:hypothetical protein